MSHQHEHDPWMGVEVFNATVEMFFDPDREVMMGQFGASPDEPVLYTCWICGESYRGSTAEMDRLRQRA